LFPASTDSAPATASADAASAASAAVSSDDADADTSDIKDATEGRRSQGSDAPATTSPPTAAAAAAAVSASRDAAFAGLLRVRSTSPCSRPRRRRPGPHANSVDI
jgi:hypothetical protein